MPSRPWPVSLTFAGRPNNRATQRPIRSSWLDCYEKGIKWEKKERKKRWEGEKRGERRGEQRTIIIFPACTLYCAMLEYWRACAGRKQKNFTATNSPSPPPPPGPTPARRPEIDRVELAVDYDSTTLVRRAGFARERIISATPTNGRLSSINRINVDTTLMKIIPSYSSNMTVEAQRYENHRESSNLTRKFWFFNTRIWWQTQNVLELFKNYLWFKHYNSGTILYRESHIIVLLLIFFSLFFTVP